MLMWPLGLFRIDDKQTTASFWASNLRRTGYGHSAQPLFQHPTAARRKRRVTWRNTPKGLVQSPEALSLAGHWCARVLVCVSDM